MLGYTIWQTCVWFRRHSSHKETVRAAANWSQEKGWW